MPNQRDVAVLAGVSSASVSRYLQNPELVSGRTGARIEEAIKELNYRIDAAARSLKTGKTCHIGILTPGIGPYYWLLFQAIQARLSRSDYYTTILHTRTPETWLQDTQRKILPYIRSNRVDGFICLPTETDADLEIIREIRRHHETVVLVDAGPRAAAEAPDLPHFGVDSYFAGRQAAELLWRKGHRKLLHLRGDLTFASAAGRLNGFRDRIRELGGELEEFRIIAGDFSAERIHAEVIGRSEALPEFTGVFAANDSMALAFMHACRRRNLLCPRDYELIGFDDNREYTPFTDPALTSFEQPLSELGAAAAEELLGRLEGDPAAETAESRPGMCRLFEPRLVVRESFMPAAR